MKKEGMARWLAGKAVQALIEEVNLTPKPALVDRRGSGAHHDLTLSLMQHSAESLGLMFQEMAEVAIRYQCISRALREDIGAIGRAGELTMFGVTKGVNTHKGAIWALGLLITAAALSSLHSNTHQFKYEQICMLAGKIACIEDRFSDGVATHGNRVAIKYGVGGARLQAQGGFPVVREYGLKQLYYSRAQYFNDKGGSENLLEDYARIDALLSMMSVLDDTCVLYRSGLQGLKLVQEGARRVLVAGGIGSAGGRMIFDEWEKELLELRASAGGAADLLAVVLFLDELVRSDFREMHNV